MVHDGDIRLCTNGCYRLVMQATARTSDRQSDNGEATPEIQNEANQLYLTILRGLNKVGWDYDEKYAVKYAVGDLLLELPEALEPEIYYPWVVQALRDTRIEDVEKWHLSRAIKIDLAIGWLDLSIDILNLGISEWGLIGLRPQVEKVVWLQETLHDLLVRCLPTVDMPLNWLLKLDFPQVAENLHDQVLMGLSPRPLLQLLIHKPEKVINPNSIYTLLDFPSSENWDDELKLDFVKACLISAVSLPISSRVISELVALIDSRAIFKDVVACGSLAATHGEIAFLRNMATLAEAYPLFRFLSQQVHGWRILEKRNIQPPRLTKCLSHFLVATPVQQQHWLQKIVRSTCPSLSSLEAVMDFWGDIQQLASLGHFGSLSPAPMLGTLIEGLLSCDAYQLVSQLASQGEELPVSPATLEAMAVAASQERFANLPTLDSRAILECCEPLAIAPTPESPAVLAWRSFMRGAYKLTQACSADRVTPLPLPVEIHLDPQAQLRRALLHPRCNLYKDMDLCYHLARQLGVSDHPICSLAVSAAVQRGDFSAAYVTCLSLMQADTDDAALEVCLGLAQNDAFRDIDKRLRLVSIALSKCPPSQFHLWLACYRELEAGACLPSEARSLFRSNEPVSLKALQQLFPNRPVSEKPVLKSHPMYASEVSSSGDDFYDGTLLPSPIEQDFRLLCMLADCRADASFLTLDFAFGKWHQVLKASDAHLYQLHLLHMPHDRREQLLQLETAVGSPEEALQAAYIDCLAALPHLFHSLASSQPVPNFLAIQPAEVLMALATHQVAPSAPRDAVAKRQLQLAEKAYHAALEMANRNRLNLTLNKLGVDPLDFHAREKASKAALLESKAATINDVELELVMEVARMADCDLAGIRLANLTYFFSNPGRDAEAYWTRAIQPYLAAIDPQRLHDCLCEAYSLVEGTHVGCLRLLLKSMIGINHKLPHPPPADQLQMRLMLLEDWAEMLGSGGFVDFKAIISHLLDGHLDQLQRWMAPLLEDVDSLAVQVPQLLALAAVFAGERDGTRPSEGALTSLFYRWGLELKVETLKANYGVVLVDDIVEDAIGAFPNLTADDLVTILQQLCGREGAECVPLATAECLLKAGLESPLGDEIRSRLTPIQARLQRLQQLSDLTDPVTEEDLGFSTIKLLDSAQFQHPDSVRALFLQLLRERISPWLLEKVAQLLPHPPTPTEALLALLRNTNRLENAADIVAGFGAQLKLYLCGGPLADWAEALRFDVKEMLLEVLPDPSLDVLLRQELLVALYNVYGLDTEEGIRVLLEWRCNLLLKLENPISLDEMLNQSSDQMPQVLVVISRYRQYLEPSRAIAFEVSVAWMRVLSQLASNPSTSPAWIYRLWVYLSHALDGQAVRDHSQAFLQTLRVYHPLAYYQIGLSLPDTTTFDGIAQEFLVASHYDLGIHDDPIIFALLLARGKVISLVHSCPTLFKAEVLPLLGGDLGYPALQQYLLRSLLISSDADVQAYADTIATQLRYQYAPKFHANADPELIQWQLKRRHPNITPIPVPEYDDVPPTLDELSQLLLSPPLPEFPHETAPYITRILTSNLPHPT